MSEIKVDMMVTHESDVRPMLVVSIKGDEAVCKFPGKEEYKRLPKGELKPYRNPGPLKFSF